ncbi:MAG: hypothetical protein AUJ99_00270 [Caldisericum sp. CG2_30_36_11]|jgi:hypothetical protein|nr:MAG: hypothetical protein AUJ99_00270 [Caldisericum sp. CG2_30_36_11]
MDNIKKREVIKKIYIESSITWFVQAMLEDSHLVALSLGDKTSGRGDCDNKFLDEEKNFENKNSVLIFYDSAVEVDILAYLNLIRKFLIFEFGEKSFIIF